ncbi:hypothetical protein [Halalkalicoccus salilacus]|uniref:hypothetical protein n=1 Tax=Halalkalicoccus TaxID=332246 RepID=UPI002F9641D9
MSDPDPEIGADDTTRDADANDERSASDGSRRGLSDRAAFWTSLLLSIALAVGSVWLIGVRAVHFEALQRVYPTIEGNGVGAGWIQGNTAPALDWAITLVHFADVIMGVFILVMVFIHWIAFRRLAARMRPPDAPRRTDDAVATDGGEPSSTRRTPEGERSEPSGRSEAELRDPRRSYTPTAVSASTASVIHVGPPNGPTAVNDSPDRKR